MEKLIVILMLALFIEAIVDALKPLWSKDSDKRMSASEIVSIVIGIFVALACRLNLLEMVAAFEYPTWMAYVFYVMTGIAIGRGTNFIYDLWGRMKGIKEYDIKETQEIEVELNVNKWSLDQLKDFCTLNGVAAD